MATSTRCMLTHSLSALPPIGCQRSSARDAWSTPPDTVQSSDNLESWGTLFASRSQPPLSYGPHHDPGVQLSIQAILMRIIRAAIRRHTQLWAARTGALTTTLGATLPKMGCGTFSKGLLSAAFLRRLLFTTLPKTSDYRKVWPLGGS